MFNYEKKGNELMKEEEGDEEDEFGRGRIRGEDIIYTEDYEDELK